MQFVPEWAPNVHPMFVHFPIGLLMTAVALDVVSLIPRTQSIRRAVPVLYVVGALTAVATYFTGQAAADGIAISADAEPILTRHADFALWTLIFFGVYAAIRVAVEWMMPSAKLLVRAALVVVAAGGLILIWETAERGSEMVYVHAVAVQQQPDPAPFAVQTIRDTSITRAAEPTTALEVQDDGWSLVPTSVESLQDSRIDWLMGDASAVSPGEAGEGVAIELKGDPMMFVVDQPLGDVQVTAELNPGDFRGAIAIVHHLQDAGSYDYLTLSSDTADLGRRIEGSARSFDAARTSYSGWINVRVTGHGTHFRGYVDDRMIVHGHDDPLPSGRVGVRVEGEGTLRIRRIQARAIEG